MPDYRTCPECGLPLNCDAADGFCPTCMIEGALRLGSLVETGAKDQNESAETVPAATSKHIMPRGGQGRIFGNYELLDEIARGGMGVVYRARQLSLDRIVALKLILLGTYADEASVRRFRAEAVAAARLQHPNIVAIHEVGEESGQPFFSMDYVEGVNMEQFARAHSITARQAARWVQTLAEATHYAHERGIIHRDLKPSNILIDNACEPRITDFGLAKQFAGDAETRATVAELTVSGQVLGSPSYVPPEQASGKRGSVGRWTDVYGLGGVLYFLLTGRPPFGAETISDTLQGVLHEEPVAPRLLNRSVPRDLQTICLKCLEKEPSRRYTTAADLAEELQRWMRNEPIRARPLSPPARVFRWCKKKPALATALVAIVAIAVGSPIAAWHINQERERAESNAATAKAAVTRLQIEKAEQLFQSDNSSLALAYLARVLRREPTNRVAAERILWALTHRNFCLPLRAFKHAGPVNAAKFSPDGYHVATASDDGTAVVWDAKSGKAVSGALHHDGPVVAVQYSRDGKKVATASRDKSARVWEPATGRPLALPLMHTGDVTDVDFSPDGTLLATASNDGTAKVWDLRTGRTNLATFIHSNQVRGVRFSPDGKWLLTAASSFAFLWTIRGNDKPIASFPARNDVNSVRWSIHGTHILTASASGEAALWSFETGSRLGSFGGYRNCLTAEFSPEGIRLAAGGNSGFGAVASLTKQRTIVSNMRHAGPITLICFSPDGRYVLTGSSDTTARIWDSATGEAVSEPLQHGDTVRSAEFGPDGQTILSAARGNEAILWEIRLGGPHHFELPHQFGVALARFSPSLDSIATVSWDRVTRFWTPHTGRFLTNIEPRGTHYVRDATYSADGRRIAIVAFSSKAWIWSVDTASLVCPPLVHEGGSTSNRSVKAVAFNRDASKLVTASGDGKARLWELSSGTEILSLDHNSPVNNAEFNDRETTVLTCADDGKARVWNAFTGELLHELKHNGAVNSARFSADGRKIVTASEDRSVRVWDTETGRPLPGALQHRDAVAFASFSPDGSRILSRSANSVHLWEWQRKDGSPPVRLGHNSIIQSAQFSPDGLRVITCSADEVARVWDVNTGHPLSEPIRHRGPVHDARFSPDGRWIITAAGEAKRGDHCATIVETMNVSGIDTIWLSALAESIAGQQVGDGDASTKIAPRSLLALRETGPKASKWAAWFFEPMGSRLLSPASSIFVRDYIDREIHLGTRTSLRKALSLCGTNPMAISRSVRMEVEEKPMDTLTLALADLQLSKAARLVPDSPEVMRAREEVDARKKQADERALDIYSQFLRTLASDEGTNSAGLTLLLERSEFLKKLEKFREASSDRLRAFGLPSRDPAAPPTLIDLSLHYNTPFESSTPSLVPNHVGIQEPQLLCGRHFDVRGAIRLASPRREYSNLPYPQKVTGLPIFQVARELHFLHFTYAPEEEGRHIGSYFVRFSDDAILEIPIKYGEDLRTWGFMDPRDTVTGSLSKLAWQGTHADGATRVFTTKWLNPRPHVPIHTIDFVSMMTQSAPVLVAISVQP